MKLVNILQNIARALGVVKTDVATLNTSVSNLSSYSATETLIGTWLGKPLYRRVVSCSVSLGASWANIANVSSYGIVTLVNCWGLSTSSKWVSQGMYQINGNYLRGLAITGGVGINYVIMEYTKS